MKKRILIIALACMTLFALVGCEVVDVDREKDMAQVVGMYADKKITKKEVYDLLDQIFLNYYGFSVYDENLTTEQRNLVDSQAETYLDTIIELKLLGIIADELYPLTDEEKADAEEKIKETDEIIQVNYLNYDPENPEAYEGDIVADTAAQYPLLTGISREEYFEDLLLEVKSGKVEDNTLEEVEAKEEDIESLYNTDLTAQKEAILESDEKYIESVAFKGTGDYVLHKAYGYTQVKHVLLGLTDEEKTELDGLSSAITKAETALTDAETDLKDEEKKLSDLEETEANAEVIAEQKKIITSKEKIVTSCAKDVEKAEKAMTDQQQKNGQKRLPEAKKIMERARAGENFDELIAEYNDDPGMKEGGTATTGYLLDSTGSGFVEEFSKAAITLKEGEVAEPVISEFGVHIIKCTVGSDEKDYPYEFIRPVVKIAADEKAKDTFWKKQMETWKEEYKVKTYPKKLKWISN